MTLPLANRTIALAEARQIEELAQMLEKEGARTLRCPLLTSDRQILGYASAGHLQVIDARL